MDSGGRRRSNAFGAKDSPKSRSKLRRHSSSRDIHSIRGRLAVEIPHSILRGNGYSSYHVYEIKVHTLAMYEL